MKRLFLLLLIFNAPISKAERIIPNFQQGILNQHTETKSIITEDIKSFDIRNGYQLTVGGTNVEPSTTNIAPTGFTQTAGTVGGTATTYVLPDLSNKPAYSIVNEGAAFSYYETLETPGIQNYTHIIRTTEIEQISDSTSTFQ
tara:strand:+ start:314 stop:742 length:429 start_codon:yes stop_codon:yes gene_type:complete